MTTQTFIHHEYIRYQGELILLSPAPVLEWDEFNDFVQHMNHKFGTTFTAIHNGADRFQYDFQFEQNRCILHYEHLSNCMWIETHEKNKAEQMEKLYQHLLLNC